MSQTPRLSPELLCLIFQYFCPHCRGELEWPHWAEPEELQAVHEQGTSALFNLCLVSRQFCDIAQGILHHQFDPRYTRPRSSNSPNPWARRLEPFLRTIATRPDLASLVKAAFLRGPLIESLDFWGGQDAYEHCASAFGTNLSELWEQRRKGFPKLVNLHHRHRRAFFTWKRQKSNSLLRHVYIGIVASELLTMLVALLPNLRHLRVEENDGRMRDAFDISTETISSLGITRLPLKTLEINRPLKMLLSLTPDLETLVSYSFGNFPQLPSVKMLRIRAEGRLNSILIQKRLDACTGHLSEFSYTNISVREYGGDERDVIDLLDQERFHATLKSIHLDLRHQVPPGHTLDMRSMPSFERFTHLETLFLTTYSIYNTMQFRLNSELLIMILPTSIRSLTLVDHDKPVDPGRLAHGLIALADSKPTRFKQLKEVRCDSKEACDDDLLIRTCERHGIDFGYQDFPRECWSYSRLPLPFQASYVPSNRSYPYPSLLPSELSDEDL